ncbi:MAG: hypothetical protein D6808_00580 [Candidatus Dadabacteria bacterium]|nr:MAG: hypothetical protein D6808_00580 [Candidatus Dadabacteria bacterium]
MDGAGSNKGMAILETAAVMTIVLFFLSAVIGFSFYIQSARLVNHILDKYLYEDLLIPFSIDSSGDITVKHDIQNSTDDLVGLVTSVADNIVNNLHQAEPELQLDQSRYYVEVSYGVADINPADGSFLGFETGPANNPPFYYTDSRGNASLVSESNTSLGLDQEFYALAQSGDYTLRTASYSISSSAYFPFIVIVGAKLYYKSGRELVASLISGLGEVPIITDYKAVVLRGTVE